MIHRTLKNPKWTVALSLILFLLTSYGAVFLKFNTDYRVFFEEDNLDLQAFNALQDTYTKNDNVLFVISPKSGKVFDVNTLKAVLNLTQKAWQLPYSIRVDSLTNFQYTFARGDELVVENFITDPNLSTAALGLKKAIALKEPLLLNRLISPTAEVTGVNVTFQLPDGDSSTEVKAIAEAVYALKQAIQIDYPDIVFRTTGVVMQTYAFTESSIRDNQSLLPLMLISMVVFAGLFFRSWVAALCVLIMMVFSVLPALGIAGWCGMTLNTATLASPIMIMTLAIADTVHILHNFFLFYRDKAKKNNAIEASFHLNWHPIILTSLTTMLGFLSLNFSKSPPFHELGNLVAIGVGWALLYSLILIPALLAWLTIPVNTRYQEFSIRPLSQWIIRHKNQCFWGMVLMVCLIIPFCVKNQLNDVWLEYFSTKLPFRQQAEYAEKHLVGAGNLHYSIKAKEANGITDPEFLHRLDGFAQWLQSQPEVKHVNVITDVLKRINKNLHEDDPKQYKIPSSKELTAQMLLLYEMSLPFGLDLNNQISVNKSSTRVQVIINNLSTNDLLAFIDKVNRYQEDHFPAYMVATATGPDVMYAHLGYTNIRTMLIGTTLALVLISLLLMFAFRSFQYGLISLLPNLLPAGVAFGLWGIFDGNIGLSLSVVTGMTFGIIVDDTIHFISKFLKLHRKESEEQALEKTFELVGPAMIITSVILIVGFGLLSLSTFKLNASMGLLTALTIGIALILDFLLLPAGLTWLSERETRKLKT